MQILMIFFLIVLALVIYFGAHYLFYFSFIHFFAITSQTNRGVILGVIIFLSFSFILATLAAHFKECIVTRTLYFLSGFWLGLLVNLLLAAVIGGLIFWFVGILGYNISSILVGCLFFSVALIFSVYGIWNAFEPRIKNIQVTIKNLPAQWKGKNIVQLSDIHLGNIYQAGFLEKIVKMSNDLHPDAVVITGDLFDGMDGNLAKLVGPLNDLQAPDGVYFITGNHETYLGVNEAFAVLKNTKVNILDDAVRNIDGLQLVGISYPQRGQTKDLTETLKKLSNFISGAPTILLYHSPTFIQEAKDAGVNLQLSGHTHLGQLFPFNVITYLVYGGYDYGLHIEGDYSIYTTNGLGTWGPAMRTGNVPEIVNITLK
jgi:uncharacterized protein